MQRTKASEACAHPGIAFHSFVKETTARRGIGLILWAAQLKIAQALAGELIAQEAECYLSHGGANDPAAALFPLWVIRRTFGTV
jgi:hypothetical protein